MPNLTVDINVSDFVLGLWSWSWCTSRSFLVFILKPLVLRPLVLILWSCLFCCNYYWYMNWPSYVSFLGVNIHTFIKCTSFTGYLFFKGSHTGQPITEELQFVLEDNKLKNKVYYNCSQWQRNEYLTKLLTSFKTLLLKKTAGENDEIATQELKCKGRLRWYDASEFTRTIENHAILTGLLCPNLTTGSKPGTHFSISPWKMQQNI